ncbi:hypothetical protein Tco_0521804 [Tanacetum coccineum]
MSTPSIHPPLDSQMHNNIIRQDGRKIYHPMLGPGNIQGDHFSTVNIDTKPNGGQIEKMHTKWSLRANMCTYPSMFQKLKLATQQISFNWRLIEIRSEEKANKCKSIALIAAAQSYQIITNKHQNLKDQIPEEDSDPEQAQRGQGNARIWHSLPKNWNAHDSTWQRFVRRSHLKNSSSTGQPLGTVQNLKKVCENKTILKQLKKANASLTQELEKCKTNLDETNSALGEAISCRDSCLIALQNKQNEFEKYKAFNDRTIDYEILQTKLNETLGLLALKDIEIKEGLKTKAYEISVLNQKHDELVKKSLLTKSQLEGYLKENTKVISDLKVKEDKDIDKMIEMDKQLKFLNEIVPPEAQSEKL